MEPRDYVAVFALRNARLRAWQAHGLPMSGQWRFWRMRSGRPVGTLALACLQCGKSDSGDHFYMADLARFERLLIGNLNRQACGHLNALLGEEPPEVVALTRLELLAGDPPR